MGNSAAVVDKVAAILSPRLSSERVTGIVELLYAQATYTLDELAAYAKRATRHPYRAQRDLNGRIDCGHNPWMHAEHVDQLKITRHPNTGIETITWTSQPLYKRGDDGPELARAGRVRTFTRFITGPPSHDLRWDRERGAFRRGFDDRDA